MPFESISSVPGSRQKKAAKVFHPRRPVEHVNVRFSLSTCDSTHAPPEPAVSGNSPFSLPASRRETIDLRLGPLRQSLLLPPHDPLSQVVGIKAQCFAYVSKREKPVVVSILHPLFGLLKKQLAFW